MSHLIYIGKEYDDFVGEAEKFGVSRNVPAQSASGMVWGEEVLCATFNPYPKEHFEKIGKEPDRTGNAELMCSFRFEEFFIRDPVLHAAVMAELISRDMLINVESANEEIERDCGAFVITSIAEVSIEISELLKIVRDLAKLLGLKAQVMVGGPLIKVYEEEEYVPGVKFTRGIMRFGDSVPATVTPKVIGLHSYHQFWTEEDKQAYKQATLQLF